MPVGRAVSHWSSVHSIEVCNDFVIFIRKNHCLDRHHTKQSIVLVILTFSTVRVLGIVRVLGLRIVHESFEGLDTPNTAASFWHAFL